MGEPATILIVEDDFNDKELALLAFKKLGVIEEVKVLEDGSEALDYIFCKGEFSDRKFKQVLKMILLDLKIPKVDGLDVLEQIKQDERTKMVPVIILTSSRQEDDIQKGYDLNVNSYIVKPVDFDDYVETVQQVGEYWLIVMRTENWTQQ